MKQIPTQEENPKGLHQRYIIEKTNGATVDPNAEYFIMRVDLNGNDLIHIAACRKAVIFYANEIKNHLPVLSKDLIERYGLDLEQERKEIEDDTLLPDDEKDKSKVYISPSKESIMAFVNTEWKQFIRYDLFKHNIGSTTDFIVESKEINYMRDLTDEEWLKLPKKEILQLYKNVYKILMNYIKLSGEKIEDIPTFTSTEYPIKEQKSMSIPKTMQEYSQQSRRNEINDILECISKYSDIETLESKGRYFEIIQKDVRNLNPKP